MRKDNMAIENGVIYTASTSLKIIIHLLSIYCQCAEFLLIANDI
jgi:hypothetical protein